MDTVIAWCGFAGAWLLVAGPLYQGALELLEEDLDREDFVSSVAELEPPPAPTRWWWLLPPVMVMMRRRRSNAYHRTVLAHRTPRQRAQRSGFIAKATGWFVVASGASLLAVKETWELFELQDWPVAAFAIALILMIAPRRWQHSPAHRPTPQVCRLRTTMCAVRT